MLGRCLLSHTGGGTLEESEDIEEGQIDAASIRAGILKRASEVTLDELSELPAMITAMGKPIDLCLRIKECDNKIVVSLLDAPVVGAVLAPLNARIDRLPRETLLCIAVALLAAIVYYFISLS